MKKKLNAKEILRLQSLGYTQKEIANLKNVTQQAISKILGKIKGKGEIGVGI